MSLPSQVTKKSGGVGEGLSPDDIEVRFFEEPRSPQFVNGWEAFGKIDKVYKQFLLILRTPEYYRKDIKQPVQVSLELRRKSDLTCTSEPCIFQYIPNRDRGCLLEKRKMEVSEDMSLVKKQQQCHRVESSTASRGEHQLSLGVFERHLE